jgi:biopolymer transport protein ExbD
MSARLAGPGGRGKYNLGQNSDMNVTPFVDVMLVLLIVFMVTAPLATTTIRLDLPPAVPGAPQHPPTYVSIADSGQIFISVSPTQMRATTLDAMGGDLTRIAGPGARIFIRADHHVKYGRFVSVLDRLRADGFGNVGLISEEA